MSLSECAGVRVPYSSPKTTNRIIPCPYPTHSIFFRYLLYSIAALSVTTTSTVVGLWVQLTKSLFYYGSLTPIAVTYDATKLNLAKLSDRPIEVILLSWIFDSAGWYRTTPLKCMRLWLWPWWLKQDHPTELCGTLNMTLMAKTGPPHWTVWDFEYDPDG